VVYTALTPSESASESEFDALLESAEHRYASLPGFIRVRRFAAADMGRTGLSVKQGEKKDVGPVLEVAGKPAGISSPTYADRSVTLEFSDESVLKSEAYQALTAWYDEALEPMVSYKNRRPFRFYKDYEPTAALKQ
jgi:hypothetical protein